MNTLKYELEVAFQVRKSGDLLDGDLTLIKIEFKTF